MKMGTANFSRRKVRCPHFPRPRGFSILEALFTVAIASALLIALVTHSGTNFRFFAQSDDTLASARAAQLLLAYLKEDVALADSPGPGDITVSPGTGTGYPKSYVHVTHDPDSAQLLLFAYTIGQTPGQVPPSDPIAAKSPADPLTRLALARAGRVQNAMAWIDSRQLAINVRAGSQPGLVTYSYLQDKKEVLRQGPDGQTHIGTGAVTAFTACPYLEFLVPHQPDRPLELLKCWLEVQIDVQAAQKADPIAKRAVSIHTKLVPKMLIATVRGLSPF